MIWDFVSSAKEGQGLSPSLTGLGWGGLTGSLHTLDDQRAVRLSRVLWLTFELEPQLLWLIVV